MKITPEADPRTYTPLGADIRIRFYKIYICYCRSQVKVFSVISSFLFSLFSYDIYAQTEILILFTSTLEKYLASSLKLINESVMILAKHI